LLVKFIAVVVMKL